MIVKPETVIAWWRRKFRQHWARLSRSGKPGRPTNPREKAGLVNRRPVGKRWPNQISEEAVEKILHLRRQYHMGPQRIAWCLERYHGTGASCSTVYRTLTRHGEGPLPRKVGRRALHTHRYAKRVPGRHIQMDVKVLALKTAEGRRVHRFPNTAIDVVAKFPFRIHTVRTDRGHEFQALFHWHVEDQGIRHAYIKPRSPELKWEGREVPPVG